MLLFCYHQDTNGPGVSGGGGVAQSVSRVPFLGGTVCELCGGMAYTVIGASYPCRGVTPPIHVIEGNDITVIDCHTSLRNSYRSYPENRQILY